MAELSVVDVEDFTSGRLSRTDPEVARMLEVALVTARQYCGWAVTPVIADDAVTLDGPDSRILMLPTRKLVTLTSISENGTPLSLTSVSVTPGGLPGVSSRPAAVRKEASGRSGWWGSRYQSIDVVMTHGYTEAEAADWRYAVLSMVDEMSQIQMPGELDLISKKVDDVTYRWADRYSSAVQTALYSSSSVFNSYRLAPVDFF
jgi:hypothetical protein